MASCRYYISDIVPSTKGAVVSEAGFMLGWTSYPRRAERTSPTLTSGPVAAILAQVIAWIARRVFIGGDLPQILI